ncbi:gll4187 [Gloeobacter violaceus PCC 7421]|uniref:Gll4187 protein n=1 Tax=Gloeobacter violaceus (strain ATCC 29082 / PCC 7421) TaxID=251221 RepID=Q7NDP6_GLOVI|nr:gll4187 [Gloeobacter violaceus PCC 7421]
MVFREVAPGELIAQVDFENRPFEPFGRLKTGGDYPAPVLEGGAVQARIDVGDAHPFSHLQGHDTPSPINPIGILTPMPTAPGAAYLPLTLPPPVSDNGKA